MREGETMNQNDVRSRLSRLHQDLGEAVRNHAWGHPQALDDLYQRLWKETKEVRGVEPPVPSTVGEITSFGQDFAMEVTVAVLALVGQLEIWLDDQIPARRE